MKRKNSNKAQIIAASVAVAVSVGFVTMYSLSYNHQQKSEVVAGLDYNKKFEGESDGTVVAPNTFENITKTKWTSQELLGKNEKVAKLWFDLRKSKKGDSKTKDDFVKAMLDLLETGETPQVSENFVLQAVDTDQTGFQTYTFAMKTGILRVYCVVLDNSFGSGERFEIFYQYSTKESSVAGNMKGVGIMPTSWVEGNLESGGDYVILGGTVLNEKMYSSEETQGMFGLSVINGDPQPIPTENIMWASRDVEMNARNNFALFKMKGGVGDVFFYNGSKGDAMDTSKVYLVVENGAISEPYDVSAKNGKIEIKKSADFGG